MIQIREVYDVSFAIAIPYELLGPNNALLGLESPYDTPSYEGILILEGLPNLMSILQSQIDFQKQRTDFIFPRHIRKCKMRG